MEGFEYEIFKKKGNKSIVLDNDNGGEIDDSEAI